MKKLLLIGFSFVMGLSLFPIGNTGLFAQTSSNHSVTVTTVSAIRLPAPLTDLSFFDSQLRLASGGMLLSANYFNGRTSEPHVDTALLSFGDGLSYLVRYPQSESVYYTRRDSKGFSSLYEHYQKRPGKYSERRVKPYRFSFSIENPVFSADGQAMVFSSDCPLGFGGRDLWYSVMHNGEWQYPQNLGRFINTDGDEISPAIYGDFLVFASNGRKDAVGGFDLYATRLVALEQTGDTAYMYPIGQCKAYSLEAPFCTPDDDIAIAFFDDLTSGWFVSRDSAGNHTVNHFSGRLDCVALRGVVSSSVNEQQLSSASVTVHRKGMGDQTIRCDSKGKYVLYLQPDEECELIFSAPEHFSSQRQYTPQRVASSSTLYSPDIQDVVLFTFPIDNYIFYSDLFPTAVACELSPQGRTRLELIARFMRENENIKLSLYSAFNDSEDIGFCRLLNDARLRAITDFLVAKGALPTNIACYTSLPEEGDSQTIVLSFSH